MVGTYSNDVYYCASEKYLCQLKCLKLFDNLLIELLYN